MVAFAYYHKKLYDTAELVLDDLFKREAAKKNANVYYVYGLVYDQTNRPDQAVLAYQKAVELNPSHASALVNLGVHQLQEQPVRRGAADVRAADAAVQPQRRGHADVARLGVSRPRRPTTRRARRTATQFVLQGGGARTSARCRRTANYGPAYYNLGLLYLDTDPFPGHRRTPCSASTTAKALLRPVQEHAGRRHEAVTTSRMKDVDKAIKRAEKQRKKKKAKAPR